MCVRDINIAICVYVRHSIAICVYAQENVCVDLLFIVMRLCVCACACRISTGSGGFVAESIDCDVMSSLIPHLFLLSFLRAVW